MEQTYDSYRDSDQEVWKLLFDRQWENLQSKASEAYLESLQQFSVELNANAIPQFSALRERLKGTTSWGLEVVPGLIPVDEFFQLLSKRTFCSSTWLRSKEMLDYLEEPDMFHDIFGHTPLLLNQPYADFMEAFGKMGVFYKDHAEIVIMLQRLYWFTIEFGLIRVSDGYKIYGAGIASSYGETNHIFESSIDVLPFDLERVMRSPFINSEIQTLYYAIESIDDLYALIDEAPRYLESNASRLRS